MVSYLIYLGTLFFLQSRELFPQIDYLIGTVVAFLISVLWSFFWNRRFVFVPEEGKKVPWLQALIKTYISYAFTGLFLNSFLSFFWIEIVGISKIVAPVLNLVISVPINFFMNKLWAFKAK